ncbi:MAG: 5'-deoxynucleotidase [Oscillospiraceae bacterium]|jgi:5'-deoxynucleotidase|nr:5'-deoxynucleotidase [Oscillospiraceae bacterium]
MRYSFFALVSRMKNISRWSLMRNSSAENVQEHSHMVAVIAHAPAVIRRDIFNCSADPCQAAACALFHDASEIFTGDLPTPIKYFDPDIMSAYKRVESAASGKLLSSLPAEMRPAYEPLLSSGCGEDIISLVKAADKLAAYIKCLEELRAGNLEFRLAAEQSRDKLASLNMPEVEYFIEHFAQAFELTLDELDFSFE